MLKIIAFFLLATVNLFSKTGYWIKVDSFEIELHTDAFWAIDCFDCDNCIAFGNTYANEPYNRYTSDGGKSWHTSLFDSVRHDVIDGYTYMYFPRKVLNVSYPASNLCIAISDSGYYWRSTDGLQTWEKRFVSIHFTENMYQNFKLKMIDTLHGLFATPYEVFKTKDGGLNWNVIYSQLNNTQFNNSYPVNIFQFDKKRILILLWNWEQSDFLIKSTDGGKTWEMYYDFKDRVSNINFLNNNIGYAGGRKQIDNHKYKSQVHKTIDGGKTWEMVLDTFIKPWKRIDRIEVFDEQSAIAYTEFSHNMWHTINGGETWKKDPLMDIENFWVLLPDIEIVSPDCMYAASDSPGDIYKYTTEPVNVIEKIKDNDLTIYPNPASSYFNLSFKSLGYGEAVLELYNMRGVLMQRERLGPVARQRYSARINAENLPAGSYYAVVVLPQRRLSGVVIKH